ncbi:MAG: translation initiation factor IF-2 [Gemmatimonadetes bacterium]|nr:translation initiation factor IF-2 [Gemmatimonadota bacterium]
MEKRRVYQVAKEQKLSSDALISMLKEMDFEIKSHMSVVSEDMLNAITRKIQEEKQSSIAEVKRQKEKEDSRKQSESPAKETPKKVGGGGRRRSTASSTGGVAKRGSVPNPPVEAPAPEKEEGSRRRNKRRGKRDGNPMQDMRDGLTEKREVTARSSAPPEDGGNRGGRRRGGAKRRRGGGQAVDAKEVQENLRRTLSKLNEGRVRRRYERGPREDDEVELEENKELKIGEFITLGEFAEQLGIKANEVISICLQLGVMATINQRLDMDTMQTVADEFGYTVVPIEEDEETELEDLQVEEEVGDPEPRSAVVTVMGHVDHGKTSLLDYLRHAKVAESESGGITQHIGAYSVPLTDGGSVTFLDTPGHAAFTAMRARGSRVTDLVILVVAADDSVMPQTIEAIDHARAAAVPMVIAINKIDLPTADSDKIKRELAERDVLVEEWGGKVPCVGISAKNGDGIDQLLEVLMLEAELLELKAVSEKMARGTIIEAKLDKGRGPVATVLVQEGTLREGDPFITGIYSSRVRALLNEHGGRVEVAGPSTPVQVLGFPGVPQAGDTFAVTNSEREAKDLSQRRQLIKREQDHRKLRSVTLSDLHDQIQQGNVQELRVIVKGDVDGSVEAISQELGGITHEEVRVNVIHNGVGAISESDVLLASASNAIILGFHVQIDPTAREVAQQEGVEVRSYKVIYEVVEEVRAALSGLLAPTYEEQVVGKAEVRQVFSSSRAGTIAGCMVQNGQIARNNQVRVVRDGEAVFTGAIASLRRFKDDVREVNDGFECGIGIEGFNAIEEGDTIEALVMVETVRTL